jgi:hypothetical protein
VEEEEGERRKGNEKSEFSKIKLEIASSKNL